MALGRIRIQTDYYMVNMKACITQITTLWFLSNLVDFKNLFHFNVTKMNVNHI